MIAGYETTSTALASSTYILATKQDIQDKLRTEIDEQEWNDDNQVNYDIVMNMNYMDLFVKEVLRMYPITTTAMTRECNTSANVCGYQIEKGYFSAFFFVSNIYSFLNRVCHSTRCVYYTL